MITDFEYDAHIILSFSFGLQELFPTNLYLYESVGS